MPNWLITGTDGGNGNPLGTNAPVALETPTGFVQFGSPQIGYNAKLDTSGNLTISGTLTAGNISGSGGTDWLNVKSSPYNAAGNGSTNDTTAVQSALTAAGTAGGGVVYLPLGTYLVGNLTVPSNVTIQGDGPNASVFKAAPGTSGAIIALASASTTRYVNLRDFGINCNSVSGCGGISIVNTGLSAATPGFHRLYNLIVSNAGSGADSYFFNNQIEAFVAFCLSVAPGRYGYNIASGATDSRFVCCTSAASGSDGFFVQGFNLLFTACKVYYAGNSGSFTTGAGFHVLGTASRNSFTCCEAQDCANNGWYFDSGTGASTNISMSACIIDSCNAAAGSGALASGINTNSLTVSSITGCSIFNRGGGAGTMPNPISVAGTQTQLFMAFNDNGCTGGLNYVSGGGYMYVGQDITDFSGSSDFKVGSYQLAAASPQGMSNGSTVSPGVGNGMYPLTTSGAVTGAIIAAGTITGQRITLVNESANSITFAASGTSNVADGVSDVIAANTGASYTWSGSLWYRG